MPAFLDDKGLNKFFQAIKAKFDTRYLNGPANSLIEQNKKSFLKVWCGTADEFKQVEAKENDIAYLVEGESADTEYAPITHAARHNKDGADPITPTAIGAVGYDAAQSLTDAQKTRARNNINAAPGGFGLGKLTGRTANSFSDITGYGFYRIPTESGFAPDTSTNWGGVYIGANLSYGTLLYARNNALMAVRTISGGEVGPIEWINPPMQLGVEYRTTERYLGKPVYKRTENIGAMPKPGNYKQVQIPYNGDTNYLDHVNICANNIMYWGLVMPVYDSDNSVIYSISTNMSGLISLVAASGNTDLSGNGAVYVTVKYTKKTD